MAKAVRACEAGHHKAFAQQDLLARIHVSVGTGLGASAVISVRREGVATDLGEVGLYGAVAGGRVGAKPSSVAGCRRGVGLEI